MADIKINDIKPAGVELFGDSESFMDELNDSDINSVIGGDVQTTARTCTGARTCGETLAPGNIIDDAAI